MDAATELSNHFLNQEWVSITLEGSKGTFSVPKASFCQASDYFTRALDGKMKEASDRHLRLPGCDLDTFRLFFYWLWNKALPDLHRTPRAFGDTEEYRKACAETQLLLARLWVFSDAYLIPKLQNLAMHALMDDLRQAKADLEAIREAYSIAAEDSALRAVLTEAAACDRLFCRYTQEDYERLGAIPGFSETFLEVGAECRAVECGEPQPMSPLEDENRSFYLVRE